MHQVMLTHFSSWQLNLEIGHIDLFGLLGIAHLYGPKKYSKPWE